MNPLPTEIMEAILALQLACASQAMDLHGIEMEGDVAGLTLNGSTGPIKFTRWKEPEKGPYCTGTLVHDPFIVCPKCDL
jgi:hypothetical protein